MIVLSVHALILMVITNVLVLMDMLKSMFTLKIQMLVIRISNDLSLTHAEITMNVVMKLMLQLIHVAITLAVITLTVHSTVNVMPDTIISLLVRMQ